MLLPSLNSASLSPGDEKTNQNIPPHSIAFGVEEIREVLGQEDSVENSGDLGLKIVSCESLSKTKSDECEKSSVQVKCDDEIDENTRDFNVDNMIPILGKNFGLDLTATLDILAEILDNSILTWDNIKSISDKTRLRSLESSSS